MTRVNHFNDDDKLQKKIETMRGFPFRYCEEPEADEHYEAVDSTLICAQPIVSVIMLAYNHERFIRQAIEGVVKQQTDFEYELVISEDCSTDNTREICFEYQRRYPKIIRVLYADINTRAKYGRIRTGWRANQAIRADWIALCEGDDFWTDPYKLQKQVDVLRKYPTVSLCYTKTRVLVDATGEISEPKVGVQPKLIPGRDFWQALIYRRGTKINTCSVMYRRSMVVGLYKTLRFSHWDLTLGDVPLFICCSAVGDVYLIDEYCCTYRINAGSAIHTGNGIVGVDNDCVSAYLSYLLFHMLLSRFPLLAHSFRVRLVRIARKYLPGSRWQMYRQMFSTTVYLPVIFKNPFVLFYIPLSYLANKSAHIANLVNEGFLKTLKTQLMRRVFRPH